jgi:2-amino-4-hydroxy-6-hydroxymethyldihydropteridine diphosphokinase
MARTAYIGVGSNVGDLRKNCVEGIKRVIDDERASFAGLSSLYRTSAVSPIAQSDFLNCALKITWRTSPGELLSLLQGVEVSLGRTREIRFGPRTLDLDILLLDDLLLDTPGLIVPHPRLHERKFALLPCLEIDPGLVHPRLDRPLAECLSRIGDEQKITLSGEISAREIGTTENLAGSGI